MGKWVIEFGGFAILYGAVGTLVALAVMGLFGLSRYWHIWPLLFTTLTFVALTQHPFPSIGTLNCPVSTAEPQLVPFRFMRSFVRLYNQEADLLTYLTNRVIAASAMNFALCLAIGLALGRHTTSLRTALIYGGALTLGIELTQLTGTWGIYPCAYRQFNVDDLILNASGVIFGVALPSLWRFAGFTAHRPKS